MKEELEKIKDRIGLLRNTIEISPAVEKIILTEAERMYDFAYQSALDSVEREMHGQLPNEKHESDVDWWYGKGYNDCNDEVKQLISKEREGLHHE